MTTKPSEADIIFNRANVALAKSQRLVASWLPTRTDAESKNAKTDEQIEKEEQEMFTPVPEVYSSNPDRTTRLGLGAKPPEDLKDWDLKRQKWSSNDQLRRQLLGKDHGKLRSEGGDRRTVRRDAGPLPLLGSKPRPAPIKRGLEDDGSDDEGGRASLGRKKVKTPAEAAEPEKAASVQADVMNNEEPGDERQATVKHSKKANNYLDEVLSQRKGRKHKAKKKKGEGLKL
ncbi:MAG: hypothetical protein L6R36_008585 [Xanthoria steineri]|nr:MAG: hypothetical protein L6R36_008585 [Xanthoria steineri]